MKRIYSLLVVSLLLAWCLGFFVLHAGPAIHTLIGLSILALLHGILRSDIQVPQGIILEIRYQLFLVFQRNRRGNRDRPAMNTKRQSPG